MPMKEWMRKLKPTQLYVVLVLTVIFFLTELIFAHLTHALTLLMDSYHMLCNIIALSGCIITVKVKSNRIIRLKIILFFISFNDYLHCCCLKIKAHQLGKAVPRRLFYLIIVSCS